MRLTLLPLLLAAGCLRTHGGSDDDGQATTVDHGSTSDSSETTAEPGNCGDGTQDPGEACGDGNDVEEDACPSGPKGQCQAAARCGDGNGRCGMSMQPAFVDESDPETI